MTGIVKFGQNSTKTIRYLISRLLGENSKAADGHPRYFKSDQSPHHTVVLTLKKVVGVVKQYRVNNALYTLIKHLKERCSLR